MKTKMTILACLLFAVTALSATIRTVKLSSFIGGGTTYTTVTAALSAAASGDTIFVAAGLYKEAELTVPAGVTIIGGFPAAATDIGTRVYPGKSGITIAEWTILDGSAAHRVATVNGIIDGCIIRNGRHNAKGGGVLISTTGSVQNCFIRGNQCHNVTNDAIGGGAYLEGSAKLINCVVDYNMASQGFAVAGAGTVTNCTIVRNTNAPTWILVPAPTGTTYGTATITPFYLAQTETTVAQYLVFLNGKGIIGDIMCPIQSSDYAGFYSGTAGATGSYYAFWVDSYNNMTYSNNVWASSNPTSFTNPVDYLSWYGAVAYSAWLGGTLPREVEWEYAATRAENGTTASFTYAGSNTYTDVAWFSNNAGAPQKVAQKKANGIGLYDMSGNVFEWCSTMMGSAFPSLGSEPTSGGYRIMRGGTFQYAINSGYGPITTARLYDSPAGGSYYVGVRPKLVP